MGDPFFCKYICPQGVLEGAIPLSLVNEGIRAALGTLFVQKLFILIAVVALSILFYRPFCKWICPLGAFYALLNKISLLEIKMDEQKCVSCGKCAASCKMDVDVRKTPNHAECIRCGKCVGVCPMRLEPVFMYKYLQKGDVDTWQNVLHGMDCIECGACAYTCPARLPLTHMFRMGKQKVNNARMAAKAKAEAEKKAAEEKKEA